MADKIDPTDPKTKKVLIVDDDESVLNLLEILVRRDGFAIELATTGAQALQKLKRKPDAMVLDLMLPGGTSGFEVLQSLRQSSEPAPPVIVVTAYAHTPEVQAIMSDPHIVLFLSKPFNQKKLLQALHKVLGTKSPHPEEAAQDENGSAGAPPARGTPPPGPKVP